MDVEPCYPLLSAELESAEALASSQQKFQTLNLCRLLLTYAESYLLPAHPNSAEALSSPV